MSSDSLWEVQNRLGWRVMGSYFIRDAMGLVEEHIVNGENKCRIEIDGDLRYAFVKRRSWYLVGHAHGFFGIWNDLLAN